MRLPKSRSGIGLVEEMLGILSLIFNFMDFFTQTLLKTRRLPVLLGLFAFVTGWHLYALIPLPPSSAINVTLSPEGAAACTIEAGAEHSKILIGNTTTVTLPHHVWLMKGHVANDLRSAVFVANSIDEDGGIWYHEVIAIHLDDSKVWRVDHRMPAKQLTKIDQRTRSIQDVKSIEKRPVVVFEVGILPLGGLGAVNYQIESWNIDTCRPEK